MAFKKGHKLATGRPKGSENKETKKIREFLADLVDDGRDKLITELNKLEGVQYIQAYTNFLEYCTPKLNRTDVKVEGGKVRDPLKIEIIEPKTK